MKWYWWLLIGLIVGFIFAYLICKWGGAPGEKVWCPTLQCWVEEGDCPEGVDGGDMEGSPAIASVRNNAVQKHANRTDWHEKKLVEIQFFYGDDLVKLGQMNCVDVIFQNSPGSGQGRDSWVPSQVYAPAGRISNDQDGPNKFMIVLYGHKKYNPNKLKEVWRTKWIDITEEEGG